MMNDYLKELEHCELCEHRCGANRLAGETGVCRMTTPVVASATLHPAPPESYTVFMAGCNFKCLNCQNWSISQYPDNGYPQRGYVSPELLAEESVDILKSVSAGLIRADRIFFSGGEPTIHLPYIERVVKEARKINPDVKVNFDTNGYLTESSLKRVVEFTTSITFDIKAYDEKIHLALTGASSEPVLRNARYIAEHARDKLWEYRVVVIPEINIKDIKSLTGFIAGMNPELPVCFLSFRPNFVLENHPGASIELMEKCIETAKKSGLVNVSRAGQTGIPGSIPPSLKGIDDGAKLAGAYAANAGCRSDQRNCTTCLFINDCGIKRYMPGGFPGGL